MFEGDTGARTPSETAEINKRKYNIYNFQMTLDIFGPNKGKI